MGASASKSDVFEEIVHDSRNNLLGVEHDTDTFYMMRVPNPDPNKEYGIFVNEASLKISVDLTTHLVRNAGMPITSLTYDSYKVKQGETATLMLLTMADIMKLIPDGDQIPSIVEDYNKLAEFVIRNCVGLDGIYPFTDIVPGRFNPTLTDAFMGRPPTIAIRMSKLEKVGTTAYDV